VHWLVVFAVLGTAVVVIPIGAWIGVQVVYGFLPNVETHITAKVHVDGRVVTVSGEANMPDGAVIAYSVSQPESDDPMSVNGTTTVRGGHFVFEADASSLPRGKADVYMSFGVGWEVDQPLNVVLTYGPHGERLSGDQVWSDSGDTLLELTVPIDVGA
jgi:hypothetical protein